MTIPYNDDTRETYVQRRKEIHLDLAKHCHERGIEHSMWLQLINWAVAEDHYGEHWDKLQEKKQ